MGRGMLADQWRAWPAGADPADVARSNSAARDAFLSSGRIDGALRSLVADSWRRCLRHGVAPEGPDPSVGLIDGDLAEYRSAHPLASVMPVIRRLLVADAADSDLLVAVSDAGGRLLWVEGSSRLRRQAEGMNFLAGALWDEASAGTNAPGTALALDHPLQIFGAEHLRAPVTGYSCSAAPIHAPDGTVLGALDVTGDQEAAAPHTLRLVTVVAAAVEAELRVQDLTRDRRSASGRRRSVRGARRLRADPVLRVLGTPRAEVEVPGGGRRLLLRQRHGELLLLLALHPHGLTGEQLDVGLYEGATAGVTSRAEVSRLRAVLTGIGAPEVLARPYRLGGVLSCDLAAVRARLADRDVAGALAAYPGPVLPLSQAPGVVSLRDDLARDLRHLVLTAGDPDALWDYARRPEQSSDLDVWQACVHRFIPGSAQHGAAREQLCRIDRDLA